MASGVILKVYTKEREKEILTDIEKKMGRVGLYLENKLKERLSAPPGKGEHPWKQQGVLRSSIAHKVDKGEKSVIVGTNEKHGGYLEFGTSRMPAYPWLFPTVEKEKGEIKNILGEKIGITRL